MLVELEYLTALPIRCMVIVYLARLLSRPWTPLNFHFNGPFLSFLYANGNLLLGKHWTHFWAT